VLLDETLEPPALTWREGLRAGGVDHAGELGRDDEHRAPHAEHPHEGSPLVERVLQIRDGEPLHARPCREVDARRIARVDGDDAAHGLLHRAGSP
jgi:hypothetical protein